MQTAFYLSLRDTAECRALIFHLRRHWKTFACVSFHPTHEQFQQSLTLQRSHSHLIPDDCKCQFSCRLFRRSSGRSVTFDQLSPSIAGSMKSLRSRAESPNRWFNSLKNKLRKWSLDLVQALSFAFFNALYFENKSHSLGSRQKIGSI